jgi:hypothetical protein
MAPLKLKKKVCGCTHDLINMNHTTNIKPPWALNKSPECFFWQYYDLKNMIFDDTTYFNGPKI